jgi:hypothetical protein
MSQGPDQDIDGIATVPNSEKRKMSGDDDRDGKKHKGNEDNSGTKDAKDQDNDAGTTLDRTIVPGAPEATRESALAALVYEHLPSLDVEDLLVHRSLGYDQRPLSVLCVWYESSSLPPQVPPQPPRRMRPHHHVRRPGMEGPPCHCLRQIRVLGRSKLLEPEFIVRAQAD